VTIDVEAPVAWFEERRQIALADEQSAPSSSPHPQVLVLTGGPAPADDA